MASTFSSGDLPVYYTDTGDIVGTVDTIDATIGIHKTVALTGPEIATYLGSDAYQVFNVNAVPDYRGDGTISGSDTASMSVTYLFDAAVPEPAGWTMMIGGSGFACGALRRRVRVPKAAFA
jgi:hypothetical protein